uniref:Plastidal glycolate/glycerate translocator 1, chloroplastic n=1 Tax=Erythrolobus australicus TaxID=1077150 RepID=A0A7S1TNE3_9RHOD|mmetsp:Transcript_3466/g.9474  ORF Transcript_3466/g.9474 Transcript_3466/m.9474 type:complete len:510 (+) Transcript_3466:250-1779(+)
MAFASRCLVAGKLGIKAAMCTNANVGTARPVSCLRRRTVTVMAASFESGAFEKPRGVQDVAAAVGSHAPTMSALCALVVLDQLFKRLFCAMNWCFPCALGGMLSIVTVLFSLRAVSPDAADKLAAFFQPGVAFLSKWLAVFFVPVLIVLPLTARPYPPARDLLRIVSVIFSTFVLSLTGSAAFSQLIRRVTRSAESAAIDTTSNAVRAPKPTSAPPPRRSTMLFWLFGALGSGCGALCAPHVQQFRAALTTCTTLFGFCLGQRMPAAFKRAVHPLLTTIGTVLTAMFAFAQMSGIRFLDVLAEYLTKGRCGSCLGGGDLLMNVLGAAILSFAFQIYARRRLIREHAMEVFGTTTTASILSLFGTALASRLAGVPPELRLSLVPRMVTAPLAICIADIIGADPALAGSVAATTGLLGATFYSFLLDRAKISDPVSRGLSTGSASHGIGTAAILKEADAFAFSATAMALCGVISTVLVSIPQVRALLVSVALGPDAAKLSASALRAAHSVR